jgi:DNA-binding beta-propeller fold protein YncE
MHISLRLFAIGSLAAMTCLAGCTARSSVVAPVGDAVDQSQTRNAMSYVGVPSPMAPWFRSLVRAGHAGPPHAFMSSELSTSTPIVYVSQHDNNAIQLYKQNGMNQSPAGALTQGLINPSGLFVASDHLLYVANTGASNILVFKRGSLVPIRTLNDPQEFPLDVAVDTDGTVYASNVFDTFGRPGSVTVWAPGATNPTRTLVVPNNSRVLFCALSSSHNLFVNYIDKATSSGAMVRYKHGSGGALPTAIVSPFPGGIEFDQFGHLAALDQDHVNLTGYQVPNGPLIFTFPTMGDPLAIALTKTREFVYVSDASNGAVYQYVYPTGTLVDTISIGLGTIFGATAVATDPSAPL